MRPRATKYTATHAVPVHCPNQFLIKAEVQRARIWPPAPGTRGYLRCWGLSVTGLMVQITEETRRSRPFAEPDQWRGTDWADTERHPLCVIAAYPFCRLTEKGPVQLFAHRMQFSIFYQPDSRNVGHKAKTQRSCQSMAAEPTSQWQPRSSLFQGARGSRANGEITTAV